MLNLIDNMALRKAIRTARNRTEAYHQLQGPIRKIYSRVFKGKKVVNNQVSAHAIRLMANCIIAYNTIILNIVYEKMIKEGINPDISPRLIKIGFKALIHMSLRRIHKNYKLYFRFSAVDNLKTTLSLNF